MAFGALRGVDLNHRPLGYEPNELPDCSTPRSDHSKLLSTGSNLRTSLPTTPHSRVYRVSLLFPFWDLRLAALAASRDEVEGAF